MKFKFYGMVILFVAGLVSTGANAAFVQLVPTQTNDGSITLPVVGGGGPNAANFTATYSPTANVTSVWWTANLASQSPATVSAAIIDEFGGTLTLAGQEDSYSSGSISLTNAFDVLAVHLGGQGGGSDLVFFFDTGITSFNVTTFNQSGDNNLSNFRAYDSGAPEVPLPAAAWLFGSALLGLVAVKRKKA